MRIAHLGAAAALEYPVVEARVALHLENLAGEARVVDIRVREIGDAHVGRGEQLDFLACRPDRELTAFSLDLLRNHACADPESRERPFWHNRLFNRRKFRWREKLRSW